MSTDARWVQPLTRASAAPAAPRARAHQAGIVCPNEHRTAVASLAG